MPPKKRKATGLAVASAASTAQPTRKRVRIGDEFVISNSPNSATGRPRRSTSNDSPQYKLTRTNAKRDSGAAEEMDNTAAAAAGAATQGRGRGRPAGTVKKEEVGNAPLPKKRSRPPKKAASVEQEAEPEGEIDEDVMATSDKPKVRGKGILKNKNEVQLVAPEEDVNGNASGTANGRRGVSDAVAEVTVKPTKKRGRPAKKDKMEESDGLTDEEALNKGALMVTHDGVDPDMQYWLMKAEPESRIEKGVDVKFSIDDLAAKQEPEGWDGEFIVNVSKRTESS